MSAPTSTPLVSIILISYNTREMTLECLRSVKAETSVDYELIVLDNGSPDGSADAIAAEFPDITLVADGENHGFAKGNNVVIKQARGEYVLLLNPDTVVLDKAIDKLMGFAEANPQAKLWGGITVFGDGSLNVTNCFERMTLWNIFCRTSGLTTLFKKSGVFNSEGYGNWDRKSVKRVDIISGCFMLMKREMWNALDGFNLTYTMYAEEADLCMRAITEHGAKPMVTPDAVIIHYGGASEAIRANRVVKLVQGKLTLIRHHFHGWRKALALLIYRYWPLTRAVAGSMVSVIRPKLGKQAPTWWEVWARRDEWWQGYKDI